MRHLFSPSPSGPHKFVARLSEDAQFLTTPTLHGPLPDEEPLTIPMSIFLRSLLNPGREELDPEI